MTRKVLLTASFLVCLCSGLQAQKFGYVDTEFILGKMPEYQRAQADLDAQVERWKKELSEKRAEIDRLEEAYRTEEILLTDQLKAERRKAIEDKRKAMLTYQDKVFGYEGLLFLKKQEIMKPLQEKIFTAIQKVARAKKLDFLFDKSTGDVVMLYTNPVHDYTEYILEELNIKETANR
jgi:outer membrane protein